MQSLKIRTEYYSTRCEICHQSDQFIPINDICNRCSGISKKIHSPGRLSLMDHLKKDWTNVRYEESLYLRMLDYILLSIAFCILIVSGE